MDRPTRGAAYRKCPAIVIDALRPLVKANNDKTTSTTATGFTWHDVCLEYAM